ncbi:MAG: NADH:ubiquinone reductase (Na(+)-transporting) subunit F [Rhodothermaceae bacterium]|nr:NADH:ubiquinone reductase (Na(+)-transporting) subunit F [Rhodothermaceae bacterium]MXW33446.1 NADH:ubiquinone reductase (Na(+)-transporting) subunit F [Rhodothermaceae bacterium]MXZ18953.1 NADH:ubiquinone reductase (Na(+)-transporting) subunit F [Rhodothermaceae bacterium]MYC03649.1 NADH:ubiquinone reductase (Na(+)-transporting) subunit F [Rhodothermaceae bacterium]MYE63932.1 NADH:ubiquinone reductase (Na(+)-transporting) subunit F [Rhodothermaceae bacterium]
MPHHDHDTAVLQRPPKHLDYSLTGENATAAIERGLAEADWYQSPVPRTRLRELLERRDAPAIRDTFIWFALIALCGWLTIVFWGTVWAILPYLAYAVLFASASDARWHEAGHGTAFRSDWMNNALYEIASFMVMRESVIRRWSHTRHHSDTLIVGRDPEILVPRPPDFKAIVLRFTNLSVYLKYFKTVTLHALGRLTPAEKTFVPESEFPKIYRNARIYFAIYAGVVGLSISTFSILPLMMVGLVNLFGSWLMVIYGFTQHAGMAENVLDHRLNCRTIYMNWVNRFLYWNMNYHTEHHMYPLVPYYNLSMLHEEVKDDCPPPYTSLLNAYAEIIPTVFRQVKDPAYHIKRSLPAPKGRDEEAKLTSVADPDTEGWLEVCSAEDLGTEDVIRFDYSKKTFALYRDDEGNLYATDGVCTHGNTHLADGLVQGKIIECSKHNGRFNLADGSPARAPVCRGLATYPLEERNGRLWLNVSTPGGEGAQEHKLYRFRVVSNRNVSTFIKEPTLELIDKTQSIGARPGEYMQLDVPVYDQICFSDFDIPNPYADVWEHQHVFDLVVANSEEGRRNNYSLVGDPDRDEVVRLNVRIATPPPGQECPPGVGSSYMFNLKPGDEVTAIGPFGDFHIKPTQKEMVYIGGGAGMGPLRAHLNHLFETEQTRRRVSYWYGARSKQEIYYADYFERLVSEHSNFSFHLALSSPLEEDNWSGHIGFIHEVVFAQYLKDHPSPTSVEYYLCGPPMMIKACNRMLRDLGVDAHQIAYDEF